MSFSAVTCITFTGTTPLTETLEVYADNSFTPFTTIPLSGVTGEECPYILTGIPDGTTEITIRSGNLCCLIMPIVCCYGKTFQNEECFIFQDGYGYLYQEDPI